MTMIMRSFLAAACLAVAATPALASGNEGADSGEEGGVDRRIGEQVDRICFSRNINGWRSVKGEDNVVLLKKSANRWFRVEVSGACPERVFRFAQSIGIDSRPAGSCVRRGDIILVKDTGDFTRRCFIQRINKWDHKAPAPGEETDEENDDNA